jgi:hypothetical protein
MHQLGVAESGKGLCMMVISGLQASGEKILVADFKS